MGRPFNKSGGGVRGVRGGHSSGRGRGGKSGRGRGGKSGRGRGGKSGHGNRGGGVNHKRKNTEKNSKSVSKSRYFDKKLLTSTKNENKKEGVTNEISNVLPSHSSKLLIGLQKFDAAFSKTTNFTKDKSLMTDKKRKQVENKLIQNASTKSDVKALEDLVPDDDLSEDEEDISEAEPDTNDDKILKKNSSDSDSDYDFDEMTDDDLNSDDLEEEEEEDDDESELDSEEDEEEDIDNQDAAEQIDSKNKALVLGEKKNVDEELDSEAGDEELDSEAGDEELDSEAGDEELDSEAGDEELDSEAGDEELDSEADDEELDSEAGDEELDSEAGDEELDSKDDELISEGKKSQSNKVKKCNVDQTNKTVAPVMKNSKEQSTPVVHSAQQMKNAVINDVNTQNKVLLPVLKSEKTTVVSEQQLNEMRIKALEQAQRIACQVLFVKPIPREYTPVQLRQLFHDAVNVRIPFHERTGHNRGYAFVDFKSRAQAMKACKAINGKVVGGKPLQVKLNDVPEIGLPSAVMNEYDFKCLFVTGLVKEATKLDVRQVFPRAEKITFSLTKDKHSVGYCFVFFHDEVLSIDAFKSTQFQQIKGQGINVSFRKLKEVAQKQQSNTDEVKLAHREDSNVLKEVAQEAKSQQPEKASVESSLAPSKGKKCRLTCTHEDKQKMNGEEKHSVDSTRDLAAVDPIKSQKKLKRKAAPPPTSAFKKYAAKSSV